MESRLYLIANSKLVAPKALSKVVRESVLAGVDIVQLREKDEPAGRIYQNAQSLKDAVKDTGAKLLINDRIDIALAVNADGVHLGQGSLPVAVARDLLGNEKIIGVSTHSLEEALRAEEQGANYIIFSHIFPTLSKPGIPPKGIEALGRVCESIKIPVFALGGINQDNIRDVLNAGVDNIAVMSSVLKAKRPAEAVSKLKTEIKKNKR